LSEKHGLRLEWAIIALIAVEVVLEFYRHWDERRDRDDPESTEALLRRYLERLAEKKDEPRTAWTRVLMIAFSAPAFDTPL